MRIITEPRVSVVAQTTFVGHPEYLIPGDGDDAVKTCAFAAKGCYDSFGVDGRPNEENQQRIVEMRHGSVLEHFSVSLFIEGITRGCSLELNRHRHFAISQRSTRYTAEEDAAIVLEPYYAGIYEQHFEALPHEQVLINSHLNAAHDAVQQYRFEVAKLVAQNPEGLTGTDLRKWARGKARNILPHALETRGTWTANLRTWRHFIELRSERYAESEIRRLAQHVFFAVQPIAPLYFMDYKGVEVNGFFEYQTPFKKV